MIERIFSGLVGTGCTIWRYRDDFQRMWELIDGMHSGAGPDELHAVLWDQTPPDPSVSPVYTTEFLSPLEWAICFCDKHPGRRVSIVDLDPGRNASALYGLYRLLATAQSLSIRIIEVPDLVAESGTLADVRAALFPTIEPDSGRDAEASREILKQHLRLRLTDPSGDDRHAITNLMGPMILLRGRSLPRSSHRAALRTLLDSVGLWPSAREEREPPKGPQGAVPTLAALAERYESLRLILVDDQWQHGWATWVSRVLGITFSAPDALPEDTPVRVASGRGLEIWATGSGNWLLDRLTQAIGSDGFRLATTLSLLGDSGPEVLLLDLRLFTGRAGDDRTFTDAALNLCRRLMEARKQLPWPAFTSGEFQEALEWINGEDHGEAVARSLLPRLVALIDHTYPIVLFSSTGRSDILSKVEPYQNIVRGFEKPRYFTEEVVGRMSTTICEALEAAGKLLRGRALCRELSRAVPGVAGPDRPTAWAEIYFDESGEDRDLRVGGLAVLYPSEEAASQFWRDLERNGLEWGYHRDAPWTNPPTRRLPKASGANQASITSTLNRLAAAAEARGIGIAAFVLRTSGSLHDAARARAAPDLAFRLLVRHAMEILLYEWLPRYDPPTGPMIPASVYVATRVKLPLAKDALQFSWNFGMILSELGSQPPRVGSATVFVDDIGMLRDRWDELRSKTVFLRSGAAVIAPDPPLPGSRPGSDRLLAYSFSFDDVTPLVEEVVGARLFAGSRPIPVRLGVGLRYYDQQPLRPDQLPRQLHYAADYAASAPHLAPKAWRDRGFDMLCDDRLEYLLSASRAADNPDGVVEAFVEWAKARQVGQGGALDDWVARRLARRVGDFEGNEFVVACGRLDAAVHIPTGKR